MRLLPALLLFAVPFAASWTLVRALDPVGRLVVAFAASVVTVAAIAQVMLVLGVWSPSGGLVAVLACGAVMTVPSLRDRWRSRARRDRRGSRCRGTPP
jgi:hypothetical protein